MGRLDCFALVDFHSVTVFNSLVDSIILKRGDLEGASEFSGLLTFQLFISQRVNIEEGESMNRMTQNEDERWKK